jgi:hypothetical protein
MLNKKYNNKLHEIQDKYITYFEETKGMGSPAYQDIISYYKILAADFPQVQINEMGLTDSGYPLHLVVYDPGETFQPDLWKVDGKIIVLINNAIHAGEPPGIDASMMFLRDVLLGKTKIPDNIILAIVPICNIGGHLNRGHSYPIKNGPLEYGTRKNAKDFDLNRDFIKADTQNTKSFQKIYHWLKPHIFIGTHEDTFNDIQHVATLVATQHNRLGGQLGNYLEKEMSIALYNGMKEKNFPMVPYIQYMESGNIAAGLKHSHDNARYSSGFAALFNTIGFMPEMNRLKPYKERVNSVYSLFETFMEVLDKDGERIVRMTAEDREAIKTQKYFALNYKLNQEKFKMVHYLGYKSGQKTSDVTGQPFLYYDQNKPFATELKWFDQCDPGISIKKPYAYIIPQRWLNVVDNLKRNGVNLERLEKDSIFQVTVYHIKKLETSKKPFEKHNLHSNVKVEKSNEQINFKKGDYLLPMNQESNRFVTEVLEPEGENSFFAWNYFDSILDKTLLGSENDDFVQPREITNPIFENMAADYLKENPDLRMKLEALKKKDKAFSQDGSAQLFWIYKHSPWNADRGANRYQIYRIEE